MIDPHHPTEAELRAIPVEEILPQRPPFIMVDTLVKFDMQSTSTETTIREGNLFVEGGKMTAEGLIENIAQTCASRIGYYNKYMLNRGVQIGFIGAIRKFVMSRTPEVGERISTTIDVLEDVFGMTLAEARIQVGEETIATCNIKIAIKDEEPEDE